MKSVFSPSADPLPGEEYPAANYLDLQARAVGLRPGSAGEVDETTRARNGGDGAHYQAAAGIAPAVETILDANADWTDRVVRIWGFDLVAANARPGGAADYTDWTTIGGGAPFVLMGYTGTGALSNVGTGAAVGAGAPPLAGTGAGGTSYRVKFPGVNAYLYVSPSDGSLRVYNDTVNPLHLFLWVDATADLGRH